MNTKTHESESFVPDGAFTHVFRAGLLGLPIVRVRLEYAPGSGNIRVTRLRWPMAQLQTTVSLENARGSNIEATGSGVFPGWRLVLKLNGNKSQQIPHTGFRSMERAIEMANALMKIIRKNSPLP